MAQPTAKPGILWKIIQFPATRIFLGSFWIIFTVVGTQSLFAGMPGSGSGPLLLVGTVVTVGVALAAYYAFVRAIEKRPVTELSTTGALRELGLGILVGAGLFTAVILVLWLLGYYTVTGTNSLASIWPMFTLAVTTAVFEELLFRGILFRIIEEPLGTWLALAFSALLFGMLHLGNPNATLWAATAIAIEAGIMLAAGYMLTRRLWLVIGIHFAWNFVQGGIFGVAVSGNARAGVLQSSLSGPVLLSGGAFGAEASIFAVIFCLAAGLTLVRLAYRKRPFTPPIWQR